MTYEQFKAEAEALAKGLEHMVRVGKINGCLPSHVDHDLNVCDCAATLAGVPTTLARMFNKQFREDACRVSLEMAREMARV